MRKAVSDIAAGVFTSAVGLLFHTQMSELEGDTALLPKLLIYGLLLGGVYLIGKGIVLKMRNIKEAAKEDDEPVSFSRIGIICAGSIGYVLAAPVIGFYVSSAVFLFVMATLLLKHNGSIIKAAILNICFAAFMCAVVWGGFNVLLSVPTPQGLFF